jgi:penicillin-binding protein 2
MEKFLTDSLRPERLKEVERIATASLMPSWLAREQYKADSARAYYYFKLTKDSAYIKKFFHRNVTVTPKKDSVKTTKPAATKPAAPKPETPPAAPEQRIGYLHRDELWNEELLAKKRRTLV